jgi:predicted nucleotidyltransferase
MGADNHAADEQLQRYFDGRREVLLAYLFGSRARGPADAASDYDLGLLLRPGTAPDSRYAIAHELAALLGAEKVDVVLLREAPVELAYNVIAEGRLVYERDLAERVEFEADLMSRYCDFLPVLRRQREDVLRESRP